MTLKIIGAGVGRTGTYSLKLALEQLGLGPCHHMEEVFKDLSVQVPLWSAAAHGKPDWVATFKGYNSAVDWPTAAFWRELAALYPEAKVILTARGADSWYGSFSETIHKLMSTAGQAPPHMKPFFEMATAVIGKTGFTGNLDRDGLIKAYNDHVRAVRTSIPAERLLVFDMKEGWQPLCKFLGLPVPATPFPRSNDKQEFWDRIKGTPG